MRRLVLGAAFALAALAVATQAQASFQKTYKVETITIVVTPSPIAFVPPPRQTAPQQIAWSDALAWDVPIGAPEIVAPSVQGNTPVVMQTVADPNYALLHVTPTATSINAGYGTTTYSCVYQVTASYKATYAIYDWVYGSAAGQSGPFPTEGGYPSGTQSYLWWKGEGTNNTNPGYVAFYNSGAPGQQVWHDSTGASETHCIDLQLTVPNSTPAGTYQAVIQYNLYVNS